MDWQLPEFFILYTGIFFFFFLSESFNLCHPLLMITFYHQTKIPISFWYKRGLNSISLIQPSEILPIELVGTHLYTDNVNQSINHHARNIPSILTICYKVIFIVYFILFCECLKIQLSEHDLAFKSQNFISLYFIILKNYFINYTIPFYNTPSIPKFYFFPILFKYFILFIFFFYYFSFSLHFPLFPPQPLAPVLHIKPHTHTQTQDTPINLSNP